MTFGYTEDEKVNISQKYLILLSKNNGLKEEWNDENINEKIIRHYTKSGKEFRKKYLKIARKLVKKIDNKEKVNNPINEKDLKDLLGVQKFNYGELKKKINRCSNWFSMDRSWRKILK